jgi:peptidoglycan hydrolase-like protein with peptidoglycan-binding domain
MRRTAHRLGVTATVAVLAFTGAGWAVGTASAAPIAPAYACAYYSGNTLTVYGDTGPRVQQARCLLSHWRYLTVSDIDGKFGDHTLHAVRSFQSDHHLTVDGEVGVHTWAALYGT